MWAVVTGVVVLAALVMFVVKMDWEECERPVMTYLRTNKTMQQVTVLMAGGKLKARLGLCVTPNIGENTVIIQNRVHFKKLSVDSVGSPDFVMVPWLSVTDAVLVHLLRHDPLVAEFGAAYDAQDMSTDLWEGNPRTVGLWKAYTVNLP
jgi:hypothetical protein